MRSLKYYCGMALAVITGISLGFLPHIFGTIGLLITITGIAYLLVAYAFLKTAIHELEQDLNQRRKNNGS